MKIVINSSYGAFSLSEEAHALYAKLKGYNLIKNRNYDDDFYSFYKNGLTGYPAFEFVKF